MKFTAGAGEFNTTFLPARVIETLARVPSMTNRLDFETNRLEPNILSWWRTRDAWNYEQALSYLQRSKLLDVTACKRVKTLPPAMPPLPIRITTNQFLGLWSFTNQSGQPFVAAADLDPVATRDLPPLTFSPGDLNAEIRALKAIYVERSSPTNQDWNLGLADIRRRKGWVDSTSVDLTVMMHHAICGLWLGRTNEVQSVFDSARFRLCFTNSLAPYMRAHARQTWELGLTYLHAGRPLTEVLDVWSEHDQVFGTNLIPELPEYVQILQGQANEFQRLLPATVEDPTRLPLNDRGRYYAERLSMARRVEGGIGQYKAGSPAPELVQIGRDALPALIEHLDDRRLTRIQGDPQTTVVLVQDLALECIEKIAGGSFRNRHDCFGKFSVLSKTNRESLAIEVGAWMNEYGAKHPAFGVLALAESKPISARSFILEDLQQRYPGVVDALPYLTRWANEAKPEEIRFVAWQLAKQGDRLALPKVREAISKGDPQNVDYLAAFGEPADFVTIRAVLRSQIAATQDVQAVVIVQSVADIPLGKRTNVFTAASFTLPILIEALGCRRFVPSKKMVADYAFPALLKLTVQPSDYSPDAAADLRVAAMDDWLAWWKTEGNAAFKQLHPEVEVIFGSLNSGP